MPVLNIGKLSPGGGEYYIGEIATSAEDYYTGHGEAAGRWVGTLAADLGLVGTWELVGGGAAPVVEGERGVDDPG